VVVPLVNIALSVVCVVFAVAYPNAHVAATAIIKLIFFIVLFI
jgi:hypothetical protein